MEDWVSGRNGEIAAGLDANGGIDAREERTAALAGVEASSVSDPSLRPSAGAKERERVSGKESLSEVHSAPLDTILCPSTCCQRRLVTCSRQKEAPKRATAPLPVASSPFLSLSLPPLGRLGCLPRKRAAYLSPRHASPDLPARTINRRELLSRYRTYASMCSDFECLLSRVSV